MSERSMIFLAASGVLFTLGAVFGNSVFIAMSLPPFFLFGLGVLLTSPRRITSDTPVLPDKLWPGREFVFTRKVVIDGGAGSVKIFQQLPDEIELLEGNNLKALWKWWGTETIEITCRLRCIKKGGFTIPALQWQSDNMIGGVFAGSTGAAVEINVWPRLLTPGQIRSLPSIAVTPYPLADIPRVGIPSTDFREIRAYVAGDPMKSINWKATARRNTAKPLVNEYEKEGKKAVLLFLDAGATMHVGNSVESLLEYAVEATGNLLLYSVHRGYRVGLAVNHTPPLYFYPESGRRQTVLILPVLNQLKPDSRKVPLIEAIEKFHNHILNFDPLSIVITSLDGDTQNALPAALRRLKMYYSRRRRFPILVVNITARDIVPPPVGYESSIPSLMNLWAQPRLRAFNSMGITVANWNPKQETFRALMSRQVKRR
jgi:uncharacterized protein (DUF58 family)